MSRPDAWKWPVIGPAESVGRPELYVFTKASSASSSASVCAALGQFKEAVVARFEPLARFNDPFVQAAALSKSPALKTFLISSYTAKVVLVEIDKDVRAQIDQVVMKWKGDVNYAFDGVTAFNQSHLLITRNSGRTTSLVKCVKLLSEVHVTETEVEESVRAIQEDIALTPGKTVASVSVDNAAASMAEQVTAALAEVPETKKALVTRDPSHCLDLGLKGLGEARGLHQETARRCKQTRPVLEHGPDRGHSGGDGGRRSDQIAGIVAARSFFVALLLDNRYVKYYQSRTAGECRC